MLHPYKEIKRVALGFQNNTDGKATHEIHECTVETRDGTKMTKWVALDVNVPLTREALYVFLDEKPRVDVLHKEEDKGISHLGIS
jgi:hypothetical protein